MFDNDFPPMRPENRDRRRSEVLFKEQPVSGTARVVAYSPKHHDSLATLSEHELTSLVRVWRREAEALGRSHAYVQIFENRGAEMGCTQPHPHGQIWATRHVPHIVATEAVAQAKYEAKYGIPMLLQYARDEEEFEERVVINSRDWLVVVPFWATWPFETLILPKRPLSNLASIESAAPIARVLGRLFRAYDNLARGEMPYSFGWHQSPLGKERSFQLHGHVFPSMLLTSKIGKFMTGFELLCEPQRDLSPEAAAQRLRAVLEGPTV